MRGRARPAANAARTAEMLSITGIANCPMRYWATRWMLLLSTITLSCATLDGCASHSHDVFLVGPATAMPKSSVVDMLVATTRQPAGDPGVLFGGERGKLAFAEVAISIPPAHRVGS